MADEIKEPRRANDGLTPARLPAEVGCGGGPLRILESEAGFGEAARHDPPTFEHELGFRAEPMFRARPSTASPGARSARRPHAGSRA